MYSQIVSLLESYQPVDYEADKGWGNYDDYTNLGESFMYGEISNPLRQHFSDAGYTLTYVDGYGGEGMGSTYYSVWKFSKDGTDTFIKFYGLVQSYR